VPRPFASSPSDALTNTARSSAGGAASVAQSLYVGTVVAADVPPEGAPPVDPVVLIEVVPPVSSGCPPVDEEPPPPPPPLTEVPLEPALLSMRPTVFASSHADANVDEATRKTKGLNPILLVILLHPYLSERKRTPGAVECTKFGSISLMAIGWVHFSVW